MNWNTIAISQQGEGHRMMALPCQDSSTILETENGTIIGVVCDGAGSAKYSDCGARVVSLQLQHYLSISFFQDLLMNKMFRKAVAQYMVKGCRETLTDLARVMSCETDDLACTVLAFVARRNRMVAFQIGDGFIVARFHKTKAFRLLFPPQRGEYANQTYFITTPNVLQRIQIGHWRRRVDFLCAATDGLERVALNTRKGRPHPPFFSPFDDFLRSATGREKTTQVSEFLANPQLRSRCDDDLTLLLARRKETPS